MSAVKRYDPDRAKAPVMKGKFGGLLVYLLALPLLPAAIKSLMSGSLFKTLAFGGGFFLAMVAATMIRRGLKIEAESSRRRIVRRTSTIPYKMTGAGLLAAALFLVAWLGGLYGLFESILFGAAAFVGSYLYYGFDPSRKNPNVAAIGITSEELLGLIEEGEGKIAQIEQSRKDIRNPEFRDRLRNITRGAQDIIDSIEDDPTDARKARKFLKVYLDGAQQVTEGYARIHRDEDSPELEDNFRRVLGTIETVIEEQKQKLAQNNLTDLDVQIEVLQMQIEKEGVT